MGEYVEKIFTYEADYSLVNKNKIAQELQRLMPITQRMNIILRNGQAEVYETVYSFLRLSNDRVLVEEVLLAVRKHAARKPRLMIIVGIGGSNLGIRAIQEALLGCRYNATEPELKVYYADSVDTVAMAELLLIIKVVLDRGHEVICVIITKSGTTTETVANAQLITTLLEQERPLSYKKSIVIITDKNSIMHRIAVAEKIDYLLIPRNVGGRFSVFSSVGLFPLAMLNIKIEELLSGASYALECLKSDISANISAQSAVNAYLHYVHGRSINDFFIFDQSLAYLGGWYRQLVGESLGKKNYQRHPVGITPTISLGTNDLHSVGQLYLGGPNDKYTTFLRVAYHPQDLVVPQGIFSSAAPWVEKKSLGCIKEAIFRGVTDAYRERERPFVILNLPEITPFWLGVLLQMKMIEIIYLGLLLEVDPFDQPDVEAYKTTTQRILSNE